MRQNWCHGQQRSNAHNRGASNNALDAVQVQLLSSGVSATSPTACWLSNKSCFCWRVALETRGGQGWQGVKWDGWTSAQLLGDPQGVARVAGRGRKGGNKGEGANPVPRWPGTHVAWLIFFESPCVQKHMWEAFALAIPLAKVFLQFFCSFQFWCWTFLQQSTDFPRAGQCRGDPFLRGLVGAKLRSIRRGRSGPGPPGLRPTGDQCLCFDPLRTTSSKDPVEKQETPGHVECRRAKQKEAAGRPGLRACNQPCAWKNIEVCTVSRPSVESTTLTGYWPGEVHERVIRASLHSCPRRLWRYMRSKDLDFGWQHYWHRPTGHFHEALFFTRLKKATFQRQKHGLFWQ